MRDTRSIPARERGSRRATRLTAALACALVVVIPVVAQAPATEASRGPQRALPANTVAARAAATARIIIPGVGEQARYWWARATGETARNHALALIVSRRQFKLLRPFRSWQDLSALQSYVEWADRPEAAGFDGREIIADVSGNDVILLRVPAANVHAAVPVQRDPVGYAVLAPAATGRVHIPVAFENTRRTIPALPAALPLSPVPAITAAVRAGDLVTVYGEALAGRNVKIFSHKGAGQILYAAPNQINARVPSFDAVAVEVNGMRSEWAEVQK